MQNACAFRHTIFIKRKPADAQHTFRYAPSAQMVTNMLIVNILSLKGQWSITRIGIFYKYFVPIGTKYSRTSLKCNCLPIQIVIEPKK